MSKTHLFMPGQTIDAALKLHNGYNIAPAELQWLRQEFNRLNETPMVRPGQSYKIPKLVEANRETN